MQTVKKPKEKLAPKKAATLRQLVKKITPKNRHLEIDWGTPKGKEVW